MEIRSSRFPRHRADDRALSIAQRCQNANGRPVLHTKLGAHSLLVERLVVVEIDAGTDRCHGVERKVIIVVELLAQRLTRSLNMARGFLVQPGRAPFIVDRGGHNTGVRTSGGVLRNVAHAAATSQLSVELWVLMTSNSPACAFK